MAACRTRSTAASAPAPFNLIPTHCWSLVVSHQVTRPCVNVMPELEVRMPQ